MGDRVILHCDMNNFFASVECLYHPELKDVPMAVAGSEDDRHGIILAKNNIAKRYGIVTAETVWQAKKKCPALVTVPPHHQRYSDFSHKINGIYAKYTDLVEPFSIDESWLDVTGSKMLFGDGEEIAKKISDEVKRETGLTMSIGVSFNKYFAKLGSDYKKPDAITVITRENYKDILYPLPVEDMIFVGKSTLTRLNALGIHTIRDLAEFDVELLKKAIGKSGESLWENANGMDVSPVMNIDHKREEKSIGNGITFRRDLENDTDIRAALVMLSDSLGAKLRHKDLKGSVVKVDIKDTELKKISRQKKLNHATDISREIMEESYKLIRENWKMGEPIRHITVTVSDFDREGIVSQMSFFDAIDTASEKLSNIERSIDKIRERFGNSAISFGSNINNDIVNMHRKGDEDED